MGAGILGVLSILFGILLLSNAFVAALTTPSSSASWYRRRIAAIVMASA
jgi:hypothetical protein